MVWTDSWLSIAGASCSLICIGAGAKGLSLVGPPRSGETSRLSSMDLVAEWDQVHAAW
jgi:hypothetical protein